MVRSEKVSGGRRGRCWRTPAPCWGSVGHVRCRQLQPHNWGTVEPLPPMLLPQASSVRPSTVLLSWKMMPRVRRMFTSSVAAALIHMALAKKPRKANTWQEEGKLATGCVPSGQLCPSWGHQGPGRCSGPTAPSRAAPAPGVRSGLGTPYAVVLGRLLVSRGEEDDDGQDRANQHDQSPDWEDALDLVQPICTQWGENMSMRPHRLGRIPPGGWCGVEPRP